ncbi:MAG: hypothetical protein U0350_09435 [Caldilineaceae bacterium]
MKRRFSLLYKLLIVLALLTNQGGAPLARAALLAQVSTPYPILFVTQMPFPNDYTTINSPFGNQKPDPQYAPRGGDLWIRYPDGTLKNLTAAAGYGVSGAQGANGIAVRDPTVYWDGTKALFSMIVDTPAIVQAQSYRWQIYEITGLGQNQTPVVTKVPNQPATYNNVTPIYGTDDRIIFTSDRPRNGQSHLYPQLDEYEEAPTVSGLWSLDPTTGNLRLLNHAPSGDFTPLLDSFGRVLFTQWDHLQRDQQADTDALRPAGQPLTYGTFNYSDESANAAILNTNGEVFPEPRPARTDLLTGTLMTGHVFNQFFPWQVNEDGTGLETINHIGRHELGGYLVASLKGDPNLITWYGQTPRANLNYISAMLQMRESPVTPGLYYGTDAVEFGAHAAGQIISMAAPPTLNADLTQVTYVTHRDTATPTSSPSANHSGLYRDPLPLSDGTVIAVHTAETRFEQTQGPSLYQFRLQTLTQATNGYMTAGQFLTPGITKSVNNYTGVMWELQPVEVRARTRPTRLTAAIPAPEQQVFNQAGVDPTQLQLFLAQNNLALVVTRNVTTRDDADKQQPYNLRIAGGGAQTIAKPGIIYDVAHLQFFEGDLLRGLKFNGNTPMAGRRVLAQPLHDAAAATYNLPDPSGPTGSVTLAADGSMAAFVPAQRALTWQLTDGTGMGVVRERNWLTFQPGEIRVCASCHGVNDKDQIGNPAPTNQPQALLALLQTWKAQTGGGPFPTATPIPTLTPTPVTTPTPTATATPVATATPATPAPTATPSSTTGSISGVVTSETTNAPLSGIRVMALRRNTVVNAWQIFTTAYTTANGSYTLGPLAAGGYKVNFGDPNKVYSGENYDNVKELSLAPDVQVTAGVAKTNINAALALATATAAQAENMISGDLLIDGPAHQVFLPVVER